MSASNGHTTDPELRLSLVVPIHNEAENIRNLVDEIAAILLPLGAIEVLLMDDASSDDSRALMEAWKSEHRASWLRIMCLEHQSGQSGALLAGIEQTRAGLVCTMDGDLQNDPRDLVKMLEILADPEVAGVTGIRANRRDTFVRRVSSRIGNFVRNRITGDRVADSGSE